MFILFFIHDKKHAHDCLLTAPARVAVALFLSLFISAICSAQRGVQSTNNTDKEDGGMEGHSKVIKNYFITRYPSEIFFVQCGLQDKQGNLWFGTAGGVWRYDGKKLKLFTTSDGLSHNCVFCIIEDRTGNIWFGTRNTVYAGIMESASLIIQNEPRSANLARTAATFEYMSCVSNDIRNLKMVKAIWVD